MRAFCVVDFPATTRPEEAEHLAVLDVEIEPVEDVSLGPRIPVSEAANAGHYPVSPGSVGKASEETHGSSVVRLVTNEAGTALLELLGGEFAAGVLDTELFKRRIGRR